MNRQIMGDEGLRRFRTLFVIGGVLFPLWGPLMAAAAPGSEQLYGGRFGITFLALGALIASYTSSWARRHIENLFFAIALVSTAFMLRLAQVNDLHVAFVICFQLLAFAVAICFESQKCLFCYLALVTVCVLLVDVDDAQVPKAVFAASTATFGLIAAVTSYDRMKLVADLQRANAVHLKDAAEERLLRETLVKREAYARALIDAIPGAVSWVDRSLKYVGVNKTQALGINLAPEDFIGREVGSIQGGANEIAQMFKDTFAAAGPALSREVTLDFKGTKVTLLLSCSKYDEGKMAVLVAVDISAQKRHEETIRSQQAQIVQSSKLSLLGEMSGGVAHEINNPLAVIVGYAQRMELLTKNATAERGVAVDEVVRFSERILSMSHRIAKIVQGLRMFAREASNDPFEVVSAQKVVQDTLELCAQRFSHHGIDLRVGKDLNSVLLECRQVQISQVILNLLTNAFDAVRHLPDRWVSIDAVEHGDVIELRVEDAGKGIDPAIASKMLQPFFTTKPVGQGTGLGLSISKGIVETHGGRLFYDAAAKNTRFVIELPRRQPQRESQTAA